MSVLLFESWPEQRNISLSPNILFIVCRQFLNVSDSHLVHDLCQHSPGSSRSTAVSTKTLCVARSQSSPIRPIVCICYQTNCQYLLPDQQSVFVTRPIASICYQANSLYLLPDQQSVFVTRPIPDQYHQYVSICPLTALWTQRWACRVRTLVFIAQLSNIHCFKPFKNAVIER